VSEPDTESRPWWKLHFSTKVVIAVVVIGLIFANVPGQEVAYVDVPDAGGKYGPDYYPYYRYEHGWPASYMARIDQFGIAGNCWTLHDRVSEFHAFSLASDIAVAVLIVSASALIVEIWRRRRGSLSRFRLIELFGLMTVVAVFAGWLQYEIRQVREERSALREALADLHERFPTSGYGEVDVENDQFLNYEHRGPTFVRELAGNYLPFARLDHVVCSDIVDANPRYADRFPYLLCISPHPPRSDEPWEQAVAKLRNLETLGLLWTGMGNLSDHPPLRSLRGINLYDSGATERDLRWLGQCSNLEEVDLTDVIVTDEHLRLLLPLKKLKALSVGKAGDSPELTDECFEIFAQFSQLENLWLFGEFHGEKVDQLLKLKRLNALGLMSPNLNTSCVRKLKQFGHLDDLYVDGTNLSKEDVQALSRELPKCHVTAR
jgi:hypothetical protein